MCYLKSIGNWATVLGNYRFVAANIIFAYLVDTCFSACFSVLTSPSGCAIYEVGSFEVENGRL